MVDRNEAEAEVKRLGGELIQAEYDAELAAQRAEGLRTILAGYIQMFPHLEGLVTEATYGAFNRSAPAESDSPGRPKGAEAVHLILQENAGERMRVSDLVGILRARDWLPPDSSNPASAIRAALERLFANSEESDVFKETIGGQVFYEYDPDRARTPKSDGGGYGFDEEPF